MQPPLKVAVLLFRLCLTDVSAHDPDWQEIHITQAESLGI